MMNQIRRVAQRATLFSQIRQELFNEWLEEKLGPNEYFIDTQTPIFSFSSQDQGTAAAVPGSTTPSITSQPFLLATIAVDPTTMLWGFSADHEKSTGPNPAARGVQQFGVEQQLAAFSTEEIPYTFEGEQQAHQINLLSHDAGQAAVEIFGPEILYSSVPTGEAGARAVYLHTNLSEAPPKPDFPQVLSRLPRLLQNCDDIGWSLAGMARLLGWRFEPMQTPNTWLLASELGQLLKVSVEYDEQGRLSTVGVKG
ncbi:DUF6882 domain-containing protein [Corynebacterium sp. A21]|uniref:DUF6882 domain-containing protein n=1 Tax=Corynebacterium sp. A21 TaxID=3457318 RepID=UPI003FD10BB2